MAEFEYLDLYNILVNEVAGAPWIFILVSLVFIFLFCAYFKIPDRAVLMIFAVYLFLMGLFFNTILLIGILAVGIYFGWSLVRFLQRG